MSDLIATVEKIVVDNVLTNSRIMPQASMASQSLLVFAGGCTLAGILLLVYAVYLWILMTLGQLIAVVCTGVLLLLIAAGSTFGMAVYKARKIASVRREISEGVQLALQLAKEDLGEAVQNNPKMLLAAACLVGLVAGKKVL